MIKDAGCITGTYRISEIVKKTVLRTGQILLARYRGGYVCAGIIGDGYRTGDGGDGPGLCKTSGDHRIITGICYFNAIRSVGNIAKGTGGIAGLTGHRITQIIYETK